MGHLQHVWEQYREKGVVVLGFNSADKREIAEEMLREKGVTYPNILDASDEAKRIATDAYRGMAVPMNYVIDRQGRIVAGFTGYSEGDRRGLDALERALAGLTPDAETKTPAGLHGTVTGPDGKPLIGAIVRLLPLDYREAKMVSTRTDGEGRYEFGEVKAAGYEIQVQVVGRANWVASGGRVYVRGGAGLERAVVIRKTTLSGRIARADTGAPLGRKEVQITAKPVDVRNGKVIGTRGKDLMAFADQNGRYTFVGLEPGAYRLWIFPRIPTLKEEYRIVELPKSGRLAGVDFELATQKTGKLRLRLRGGVRDPSFTIETGPSSVRTLHGEEVQEGVFEFELEVGERVIHVSQEGARVGTVRVKITEGKTRKKDLRLR